MGSTLLANCQEQEHKTKKQERNIQLLSRINPRNIKVFSITFVQQK